jgi:hypothetical protein
MSYVGALVAGAWGGGCGDTIRTDKCHVGSELGGRFLTVRILVCIMVVVVLSVVTTVAVAGLAFPKAFGYGMTLVAERLTEKPDDYIPLANPDPYVLQAVAHPGDEVVVGAWDNSEFDEMMSSYGTNHVEINGKYNRIHVYSKETFVFSGLFWLSIAGWVTLGIVKVVTARASDPKDMLGSRNGV